MRRASLAAGKLGLLARLLWTRVPVSAPSLPGGAGSGPGTSFCRCCSSSSSSSCPRCCGSRWGWAASALLDGRVRLSARGGGCSSPQQPPAGERRCSAPGARSVYFQRRSVNIVKSWFPSETAPGRGRRPAVRRGAALPGSSTEPPAAEALARRLPDGLCPGLSSAASSPALLVGLLP